MSRPRYSDTTRAGQLRDAQSDLKRARTKLAALPSPREDDEPAVSARRHRAQVAVALLEADVAALRTGAP